MLISKKIKNKTLSCKSFYILSMIVSVSPGKKLKKLYFLSKIGECLKDSIYEIE